MDDLRPKGSRVAVKLLTWFGWLAFLLFLLAFVVFGLAREGRIWGCWG